VAQGFENGGCSSDDDKGSARKKISALRRNTTIGRSVGRPKKAGRT
jgi:hypothetical protein